MFGFNDIVGSVSPDFHWQKSLSTVGRNSFRKSRLGYLDVAITKIRKTCMQSCAIDSQQGYLDVAVAKKNISETCEKWSRKYLVSESWGAT